MRRLLYLFVTLWISACGGSDCIEPGGVPSGGLCDSTPRALQIIDDVFERAGHTRVADWIEVIWLDAPYLDVMVDGEDDHLYGRAWPAIDLSGPRCLEVIATRKQPLFSRTSLAHEHLHCSFVVGFNELDGDMNHSRIEWKSVVPDANAALAAEGL